MTRRQSVFSSGTAGISAVASQGRALSSAALDLLAPERCLFCDQLSERNYSVCAHCEDALVTNDQPCPVCALPDCGGQLCPRCLDENAPKLRVIAPFTYDAMLAHFMHCWKYNGEWRLAKTAAQLMLNACEAMPVAGILIPTPLHRRRQMRRGFNQSEDLVHQLRRLAPDCFPSGRCPVQLRRTRHQSSQAHASRGDRRRQVSGAFQVRGRLNGEAVTIVDDVYTTGATADAMTRVLQSAGAGPVTLLCLARTPAHGSSR